MPFVVFLLFLSYHLIILLFLFRPFHLLLLMMPLLSPSSLRVSLPTIFSSSSPSSFVSSSSSSQHYFPFFFTPSSVSLLLPSVLFSYFRLTHFLLFITTEKYRFHVRPLSRQTGRRVSRPTDITGVDERALWRKRGDNKDRQREQRRTRVNDAVR